MCWFSFITEIGRHCLAYDGVLSFLWPCNFQSSTTTEALPTSDISVFAITSVRLHFLPASRVKKQDIWAIRSPNVADFQTSFTVGLNNKRAVK